MEPTRRTVRWVFAPTLLWVTACAPIQPFGTSTPGLDALAQEQPWLDQSGTFTSADLSGTDLPEVSQRMTNLLEVYREELTRARAAQGGPLSAILGIASIVLPVSGTATALLISDSDDAAMAGAIAAAATTVTLGLNTVLKPGVHAAAASACERFLVNALQSLELRWPPEVISSMEGAPEDWQAYFAIRSALHAGRTASCEG